MKIMCNFPYHGPTPILLGEKPGGDRYTVTHGICPICKAEMLRQIEPVANLPSGQPSPCPGQLAPSLS